MKKREREREREREEVDKQPNLPGVFFFFLGETNTHRKKETCLELKLETETLNHSLYSPTKLWDMILSFLLSLFNICINGIFKACHCLLTPRVCLDTTYY